MLRAALQVNAAVKKRTPVRGGWHAYTRGHSMCPTQKGRYAQYRTFTVEKKKHTMGTGNVVHIDCWICTTKWTQILHTPKVEALYMMGMVHTPDAG